jgi:hypothetical protein
MSVERVKTITNPQMAVVGMVFYIISPNDKSLPATTLLDLMGFKTINIAWVDFSGSITISDIEPQTLKTIGTPASQSLSGSGEVSSFFTSATSLISISLSGTPSASSLSVFVF